MKKKLLALGIIGAFLLVGCSKQPNLENAKDVNETNNTQKKTEVVQKVMSDATPANETVNTANANVETQTINSEETGNTTTQNQQFAQQLSAIVVHFDFDKYNIKPSEWPKVEKLAELIKSHNGNYTVRIEGNCDEWGTEEYNYALGLKRANTVKNALIKLGVDPKKLTIISYGELNPVCTAHAKWCWRLNRRDNFTYLP
jgi:peptidoglycan-associated lipoprotein